MSFLIIPNQLQKRHGELDFQVTKHEHHSTPMPRSSQTTPLKIKFTDVIFTVRLESRTGSRPREGTGRYSFLPVFSLCLAYSL